MSIEFYPTTPVLKVGDTSTTLVAIIRNVPEPRARARLINNADNKVKMEGTGIILARDLTSDDIGKFSVGVEVVTENPTGNTFETYYVNVTVESDVKEAFVPGTSWLNP